MVQENYLQGNNGGTDIENKHMDMGRGEERVRCMQSNMETYIQSVQFSSVAQSCLTLCDPMNRSMPGLPCPISISLSSMSVSPLLPCK